MNWLVGIGLFALVGICSYFGIEHHLDSKAFLRFKGRILSFQDIYLRFEGLMPK